MNIADMMVPENARSAMSGHSGLMAIAGICTIAVSGREDEPDGGQMRVAAEQHALGRRYPRQCVAEDEPVPHLQPVTDGQVQNQRAQRRR